jgi:hypothetical protein
LEERGSWDLFEEMEEYNFAGRGVSPMIPIRILRLDK